MKKLFALIMTLAMLTMCFTAMAEAPAKGFVCKIENITIGSSDPSFPGLDLSGLNLTIGGGSTSGYLQLGVNEAIAFLFHLTMDQDNVYISLYDNASQDYSPYVIGASLSSLAEMAPGMDPQSMLETGNAAMSNVQAAINEVVEGIEFTDAGVQTYEFKSIGAQSASCMHADLKAEDIEKIVNSIMDAAGQEHIPSFEGTGSVDAYVTESNATAAVVTLNNNGMEAKFVLEIASTDPVDFYAYLASGDQVMAEATFNVVPGDASDAYTFDLTAQGSSVHCVADVAEDNGFYTGNIALTAAAGAASYNFGFDFAAGADDYTDVPASDVIDGRTLVPYEEIMNGGEASQALLQAWQPALMSGVGVLAQIPAVSSLMMG